MIGPPKKKVRERRPPAVGRALFLSSRAGADDVKKKASSAQGGMKMAAQPTLSGEPLAGAQSPRASSLSSSSSSSSSSKSSSFSASLEGDGDGAGSGTVT